jgi:hypothetical protein
VPRRPRERIDVDEHVTLPDGATAPVVDDGTV